MKQLHIQLLALNACSGLGNAVPWSKTYGRAYRKAWRECKRGDWLLWLCSKLNVCEQLVVRAACACAREALQYVPDGENRPLIAIETAERWCDGEATIDEVKYAARAASAARAFYAADYAVAYAAASAVRAAYAADYAAASADAPALAAAAAYAAARAAYAADYADAPALAAAAAYAAARADLFKRSAELVRGIIPWKVVRDAAKKKGLM